RATICVSCPKFDVVTLEKGQDVFERCVKSRVLKLCSHGAAYDFWIPQVNGAGQSDRGGGAQSRSGAEDCAGISRILNSVEQNKAAHSGDLECIKRATRNFADRDYALRRLGFRCGAEIFFGNLCYLDAGLVERFSQRLTAWSGGKLRSDERTTDG